MLVPRRCNTSTVKSLYFVLFDSHKLKEVEARVGRNGRLLMAATGREKRLSL
jgi:hypothetical protein